MADKTTQIDVLIGGQVYHLTGAEPEYLQRVSAYINKKMSECRNSNIYRKLDADYRTLLLNLNIADDYFKCLDENAELRSKLDELEKELYAVRHDAVSTKMKLENSLKQQEVLEGRIRDIKDRQSGRGY